MALPGCKVTSEDRIALDGKLIQIKTPPKVYWMLNKPDFTLVGVDPTGEKKSIFELPKLRKIPFRFSSAGRLDFRTEGLLVLSNDGGFLNKVSHPSSGIQKEYFAVVNRKLTDAELSEMRSGVSLKDGVASCRIHLMHSRKLGTGRGAAYSVEVTEGRNRLVRRLFEHFGIRVVRLARIRIGQLELPETLMSGEYCQLTSNQIAKLLQNR